VPIIGDRCTVISCDMIFNFVRVQFFSIKCFNAIRHDLQVAAQQAAAVLCDNELSVTNAESQHALQCVLCCHRLWSYGFQTFRTLTFSYPGVSCPKRFVT